MVFDYYIAGGYIKIHKTAFVKEMLSKDSILRLLLNWKSTKDYGEQHPQLSEADENNIITINFSNTSGILIGESQKDILTRLKSKYKGLIKGKISCRTEYSMFGGIFTSEIDLDSEDETIDYSTM